MWAVFAMVIDPCQTSRSSNIAERPRIDPSHLPRMKEGVYTKAYYVMGVVDAYGAKPLSNGIGGKGLNRAQMLKDDCIHPLHQIIFVHCYPLLLLLCTEFDEVLDVDLPVMRGDHLIIDNS